MLRPLFAGAMLAMTLSIGAVVAQERGGVLNVATVGEPPTLDPMLSTADLVGTVAQHIFETLYTFDRNWSVSPLLAEGPPLTSADGLLHTIKLRRGVKFHDGSAMQAVDVVASIRRWMKVATRGKQAANYIDKIEAPDERTVRITLKRPFAPLLALLAFNNSAAVIIPARNESAATLPALGTGPYMLKEHKPDQYIRLVRFPDYQSRTEASNRYGGRRQQYVDEIRFVPVPDPNTRVEGAVAGQFDYVDSIPVESFARLKQQSKSLPLLIKPFGYPLFVLNTRQGVMQDLKTRLAVRVALGESDMLLAAYGDQNFFTPNPAFYPPGHTFHSLAGTAGAYNLGDMEKAAQFRKESKYDGKPIRILTSRQYEFHYKLALVASEFLSGAGFKVDLQVVDWATLTQRRTNAALWDIYITHSPFLPEPSLMSLMSESAPGWWATPKRKSVVEAFNSEPDPALRIEKWSAVQKAIYDEVPAIKIGDFNTLAAVSPALKGVEPSPWPYFWNTYLKTDLKNE